MKIPDTHLYSAYKALMGKEASPTPPPLTTITATLVLVCEQYFRALILAYNNHPERPLECSH